MKRALPLVLCLSSLSACGFTEAIQNNATQSGFVTPSTNGAISVGLSQSSGGTVRTIDGNGYAFQAGSDPGEGLAAYSGILPGTQTDAWPTSGAATYSGTYEGVQISGINLDGAGFISGMSGPMSGTLTLSADFAQNTLTGTSDNGLLTVDGQVGGGGTLSGSVNYQGVGGDLTELAGGDTAVGAFHRNNADLIYAGGFIADRD